MTKTEELKAALLLTAALLIAVPAQAQTGCCTSSSTGAVYTSTGAVVISAASSCCLVATPDDATLAAWAAKKAVEAQLDWLGKETEIEKYDRAKVDELQARVDDLCKWAKTLSNHIFRDAYAEWGSRATHKLNERRASLDKLDVAKSLVTGLPTPPTK